MTLHISYEDVLDAERRSDPKHEWLDGVVYAMAGVPSSAIVSQRT